MDVKDRDTVSIRHLTPDYDKLKESIAEKEEIEWEGCC